MTSIKMFNVIVTVIILFWIVLFISHLQTSKPIESTQSIEISDPTPTPKPTATPQPKTEIVTIESYQPVYQIYEMTAYTAGYESTRKTPEHPLYGITASGKIVQEWHTIACPRSMPFGTRIYIPYFETIFTCEDRGSAITEGKLDIYIEDLELALEFGRRHLEAMIIEDPEQ
jgi:3D (Asp-Asp-Asp) domain-containing protein